MLLRGRAQCRQAWRKGKAGMLREGLRGTWDLCANSWAWGIYWGRGDGIQGRKNKGFVQRKEDLKEERCGQRKEDPHGWQGSKMQQDLRLIHHESLSKCKGWVFLSYPSEPKGTSQWRVSSRIQNTTETSGMPGVASTAQEESVS